jgi:hypothetical protein
MATRRRITKQLLAAALCFAWAGIAVGVSNPHFGEYQAGYEERMTASEKQEYKSL